MNSLYRKTEMVKADFEVITPEKANKMLEKNFDNRNLRPSIVREYASYMKNGLWRENGESILITKEGYILNGQHRLHAIIASGVSIRMLIVTVKAVDGQGKLNPIGVPQDRGASRSHSDISGVHPFSDKISAAMIRELLPQGPALSKNTALRKAVFDSFSEEMTYFRNHCSTAKRYVSRASIHAALVLRLYQGYDFTEEYHSVLTDMSEMNSAWASWLGRVVQIQHNNRAARIDILALTWALTEPDRDNTKPVRLSNQRGRIDEMQNVFYDACEDNIKHII